MTGGEEQHGETISIARLEHGEWIITNADNPAVAHHGVPLKAVLKAHQHAVAFHIGRPLTVRYLIGDDALTDRIVHIRSVGAQVAALRRDANRIEATIRTERAQLARDLAALHIPDSEIAYLLGIPTTAVPRALLETPSDQASNRRSEPQARPEGERLF